MKMNEIMSEIADLACSQGFYGRLYRDILELKREDPETYEQLKAELEAQNFATTLDMVLYFEQ